MRKILGQSRFDAQVDGNKTETQISLGLKYWFLYVKKLNGNDSELILLIERSQHSKSQ